MDGQIRSGGIPDAPSRMHALSFGLFRGALRSGPPEPTIARAALRHKRWIYVAVCAPDMVFGVAVANVGYASNAFAYLGPIGGAPGACDAWKSVSLPGFAAVDRRLARWRGGGAEWDIALPDGALPGHLRGHAPQGEVSLELRPHPSAATAPTSVTCVAPVGDDMRLRRNLTIKDNSMTAVGTIRWGGVDRAVDAPALFDVTDAYPRRRTAWHWLSCAGRDVSGRAVGVNLCAIHNDSDRARENAVWLEGVPRALGAVRFEFDRDRAASSVWRIKGERVDLRFEPAGARVGNENLLLVKSRFVQPYGVVRGEVGHGEEILRLDGVTGVVEDHEAVW